MSKTFGDRPCTYSDPDHRPDEVLPASAFGSGQYACNQCKNKNLRKNRAIKKELLGSVDLRKERPSWPVPMSEETTAPGVPPASLLDGSPDVAAMNQGRPEPERPEPDPPLPAPDPKLRLLHIDIETTPAKVLTWALHKQDISVDQVLEPTSVLCFAAKWHGEPAVMFHSAKSRDGQEFNDMIRAAHKLLCEADAVCHYNGTRFDTPRLAQEFLRLGLGPTPPIPQIDLCSVVQKRFSMLSSKLAFVAPYLKIGEKVKHAGWGLWRGCLDNEAESWLTMETYNREDTILLERLYAELLPWIDQHPNMNLLASDDGKRCPNCGKNALQRSGLHLATTYTYPRYKCGACMRWCRDRKYSKTDQSAQRR